VSIVNCQLPTTLKNDTGLFSDFFHCSWRLDAFAAQGTVCTVLYQVQVCAWVVLCLVCKVKFMRTGRLPTEQSTVWRGNLGGEYVRTSTRSTVKLYFESCTAQYGAAIWGEHTRTRTTVLYRIGNTGTVRYSLALYRVPCRYVRRTSQQAFVSHVAEHIINELHRHFVQSSEMLNFGEVWRPCACQENEHILTNGYIFTYVAHHQSPITNHQSPITIRFDSTWISHHFTFSNTCTAYCTVLALSYLL
jgi:hypothetical protein